MIYKDKMIVFVHYLVDSRQYKIKYEKIFYS
jgi:hypothetical protein